MKTNELLKTMAQAAKHKDAYNGLHEKLVRREMAYSKLCRKLAEDAFFADLEWSIKGTLPHCEVKNGILYARNGAELSRNGKCMGEQIPYFVNEIAGCCGTMYVKVDDKNTFVVIAYER